MRHLSSFIAIIIVCLLGSQGGATPSTLIWIPSTDIQPQGIMHLGIDQYPGPGPDVPVCYGLTFGTDRIEYGIDYFEGLADPLFLNAKVLLKEESGGSPRLVAGILSVGSESDTSSNVGYVLGSRTGRMGRLTFGYALGRERVLGDDSGMLLLGFDKTLNDRWWVGADFQSGKSSLGALNIGVAYKFTPAMGLIVGYDWYNDPSTADTLTLQLDWDF